MSVGIPQATSTFSMDRRTSATLSVNVLPHSSVIVRARSLMFSSRSVLSLNSGWMRSAAGLRRHSTKAFSAAVAAAFTSSAGERGTSAITSAEAGFRTCRASPACDGSQFPATKLFRRISILLGSQVIALLFTRFFVLSAGLLDCRVLGHFGDRDIPPALIARYANLTLGFDDDDGGSVEGLCLFEGLLQLADVGRLEGVSAQARGIRDVIDRQIVAIVRAESAAPERLAQAAYAREAVVVDQDDNQFHVLLNRRHDFGGRHEVRTVAEEDIDLAAGVGQFRADRARDFIAHARVTVFEVIAVGRASAPELVKVAGVAAGSGQQDIARAGGFPNRSDHFALGGFGLISQMEQAVDFGFPLRFQVRDVGSDVVVAERVG